jgi:hypothetical protein
LVALSAKKIETRSWRTNYTGPVAIHAAKGFPKSARDFHYAMVAQQFDIPICELPTGYVIATANIQGCRFTQDVAGQISAQELSFGDYSYGRYAWFLSDIVPLAEPIPATGHLSLWEWAAPWEQAAKPLEKPGQ